MPEKLGISLKQKDNKFIKSLKDDDIKKVDDFKTLKAS